MSEKAKTPVEVFLEITRKNVMHIAEMVECACPRGLFCGFWKQKGVHGHTIEIVDYATIVFFLSGARVKTDNDMVFDRTRGAGQAVIVPANAEVSWQSAGDMLYLMVCLPSAVINNAIPGRDEVDSSALSSVLFIEDKNLNRLGWVLVDLLMHGKLRDQRHQLPWADLLITYVSDYHTSDRRRFNFEDQRIVGLINQAVTYIDKHLNDALTVSQVAEQVSLSRKRFSREFKRIMGRSPYQFILERRLLLARELLATTKTPLAEISYCTGFSSQSHMTSAFQKTLGVTPRAYRQL